MGRYRKQDRELKETFNEIKESSRATAENTGHTNEKLDAMQNDIDLILGKNQTIAENIEHASEKLDAIKKDNAVSPKDKGSKIKAFLEVAALLVTISGVSGTVIYNSLKPKSEPKTEAVAAPETRLEEEPAAKEPEYEIYLYPEYSTIDVGTNVEMTATLNFETDAVDITAHLASGKKESVSLMQKSATEWKKEVYFDQLGVHEIVVTATAPSGEVIKNSIEVEVVPISIESIDMEAANQLFIDVYNGLVEAFQAESSTEQTAFKVYSSFLSGDRTFLDDTQSEMWWIPDFQEDGMEYEYTCLDLDGDEVAELVIQMKDDPCSYNGVFHYDNGKLVCWNSDAAEMSCRDYPLADGTMVRQYDYNGTSTYTIFRYRDNREKEDISCLFAREELIPEDSSEPCPYYEIDGQEVDEAVFYGQLKKSVTDRMVERVAWKRISMYTSEVIS